MAEELNGSLEYTPTWIVAVVCSIIVFISLCVERALHWLGKYLVHKNQDALFQALQKLKEELMLLGFISLLLTVSQGLISRICIPHSLVMHMLPCKRPNNESTKGSEHYQINYNTIFNTRRRRLFSQQTTTSNHCIQKGKVPLLSLESLHHLHIFIFVLAVVHAFFCVTTMVLGSIKIRQWKKWEDEIRQDIKKSKAQREETIRFHQQEFLETHTEGHWRKAVVVAWIRALLKQFHGSVTKSDYIALRQGFIKVKIP
ncbi:MLO-like protein 13 [Senna tora]|uniref:MLO-like protein 13 n=1 Tax=Senna tora TaxID=362788 RepID=A0A835CIU9_9FABA|nr:MLO-like protein 13 [Senna tora]